MWLFLLEQPTYFTLLVIPQKHVPYKYGSILKENNGISKGGQEAMLQQRNNLSNTYFLTFCAQVLLYKPESKMNLTPDKVEFYVRFAVACCMLYFK